MVSLRRLKIELKKQAQKGVSLKAQNRTIGVVFSYEELNTNVLFNAVLRNLKRNNSIKVIAYVPVGFGKLFFSADEIIEIPNYLNKFKKYSEVSEYFPPQQIQLSLKFGIKSNTYQLSFIRKSWLM